MLLLFTYCIIVVVVYFLYCYCCCCLLIVLLLLLLLFTYCIIVVVVVVYLLYYYYCCCCLGPTQFQIQISYTFQSHNYVLGTDINIYITDTNDNIPIFSLPSYQFSFTEDLLSLSLIGFVLAVDNDGDPYNCISKISQ